MTKNSVIYIFRRLLILVVFLACSNLMDFAEFNTADYLELQSVEAVERAIKEGRLEKRHYVFDFDQIANQKQNSKSYKKYFNGVWLTYIRRYDDAEVEFYRALNLIEDKPDTYLEMLILEKLIEINEQKGELIAYQENAMKLRELSAGVDDEIYIKAIYAIADIHYHTHNFEAAQSYLTAIFELSQSRNSAYGMSRYHYLYGLIESSLSNCDDAIYHMEKAYDYGLEADQLLAYDYIDFLEMNLAIVDLKKGAFEEARTRLNALLSRTDKISPHTERDIYYQLGTANYYLEDYEDAATYLKQSLLADYSANTSYEVNVYSAEIYTMLGLVYDAMGDATKAIGYFKNATELSPFSERDEIQLIRVSELNAYEIDELQKELHLKKRLRDANENTILLQNRYLRIGIVLVTCLIVALIVLVWMNYIRGRIQKKLYLETIIDHLTKVYNRGHIIEILEDNKTIETCILLMDIDDFKMINDTFGHVIGDKVLIRIAKTISKNLRDTDAVGRYGGEEFLVVLRHTDMESGRVIAERIRKAVEEIAWEEKIVTTISIGLLQCHESETDELLSEVDILLYRAKSMGKNRVIF